MDVPFALLAVLVSVAALAVALLGRRRAPTSVGARPPPARLEPAPAAAPEPSVAPAGSSATPSVAADATAPRAADVRVLLEERLNMLDTRLAALEASVVELAAPPNEDVVPMRPVPRTFPEAVAVPRSGWRMFP